MNKNEIINNYEKGEFSSFLSNDHDGKVLELLDSEGLSILENSPLIKDRIAYILTFSKYTNDLFQNEEFLDIFFKTDISYYYACLSELSNETYDVMIDHYSKLNPDSSQFARFLSYINVNYKLKKLDNWPFDIDILYKLINIEDYEIVNKILANYNIDLSDNRINIDNLIMLAKSTALRVQQHRNRTGKNIEGLNIPVHMINKTLAKKLFENYNIYRVRKLISELEYSTNPEDVNNYIKKQEDFIISNYDEYILNSPYQEIYETYKRMQEALSKNKIDECHLYKMEYRNLISSCKREELYFPINNKENNTLELYNYLKEISDREISNYIIDYHFEENYHNIMLDVRELLRFYYDGNIVIKEENVDLYSKISNIDFLQAEEKKELHNKLKQINIKEMFYDDMSLARYIVHEAIKESSLTKESIKKYKDEKLSKQYGIDIYMMNDEPFFGIVKSGSHITDEFPTGHSYSLIGNDCVAIFGDPEDSNTYLYDADDLNPNQIVHVFPFDSYTLFKPFNTVEEATNRVHPLMMPEEITGFAGNNYSEILILEKGRKKMDMDANIPELKRIALYCIDEISQKDIEYAQQQGIGIILVNSKKYLENHEYYKEKYKNTLDQFNYNYFNGSFKKNDFEAKR